MEKFKIDLSIDIVTKILLIGCVFACLSLFYTYFGGSSSFCFENPDGRTNCWFLSSLSNAHFGGSSINSIRRPSFIYDESGSFAFIIASCITIRNSLNLDKKYTSLLLVFGIVTTSLSYYLFFFLYIVLTYFAPFLASICRKLLVKRSSFVKYLTLAILVCLLTFIAYSISEIFRVFVDSSVLDRLFLNEGGIDLENNRVQMLRDTLSLDFDSVPSLFFGISRNCFINSELCIQDIGSYIGSTVLSPLYLRGLLISFSYYLVLVLLIFLGLFKPRYNYLLPYALILLQRPGIYTPLYAIWGGLLVSTLAYRFSSKSMSKARL